jgi:hypothetical protein
LYSTLYSCQILMKLEFPRQTFEKFSNIRFHEIPSSGSRVVPRGQTMTKLIVTFRNVANAPKKYVVEGVAYCSYQSVDLNAGTDTQHDDLISRLFYSFKQGKWI